MATNKFVDVVRSDFYTFAHRAHRELTGSRLEHNEYLRLLADDVERVCEGSVKRFVCNMPPGHGKTFMFSVAATCWILAKRPTARILITSYGEELATSIARQIRTIVSSPWFESTFPKTCLEQGNRSVRDFATTAGGRVLAVSIDGAVTGRRCDYLIVDDPVQIRDANNAEQLEYVNSRFDTDLASRLNNPKEDAIIVVHHRLNRKDLTGHLKERSGWVHRELSLIAEAPVVYALADGAEWRRNEGDLLRPNAFDNSIVQELREQTGAPGFGPLYQQRFDGADVLQVARDNFVLKPVYKIPAHPFVLSVDLNHRGEEGRSYSVIQVWVVEPDGGYLLFDQWRERALRSVLDKAIRAKIRKYGPRAILIEDNGPALEIAQSLSPRQHVELIKPHGDKMSRLRPHLGTFHAGKVRLPAGAAFIEHYLSEFEAFPYGDFTDQVDGTTQFLTWIATNDLPAARQLKRATPVVITERSYLRKSRPGFGFKMCGR